MDQKSTYKYDLGHSTQFVKKGFHNLLFSTNEFVHIWKEKGLIRFFYPNSQEESLISCSFHINGFDAVSLPNCPYAGIEPETDLSKNTLMQFLEGIVERLKSKGATQIVIRQAPEFYFPDHSLLIHDCMIETGFRVNSEINHHIELNNEIYWNEIHQMEQRKIKKCQKEGFTFRQEYEYQEIYKFISKCRDQQEIEINISFEALQNSVDRLADSYHFFTIRDKDNTIIAATVMVTVNDKIVYNYLPAFDRTYKSFSPLALMMLELHHFWNMKNFDIMDLGIASIDGMVQEGLATFKERMGGKRTHRHTYIYQE